MSFVSQNPANLAPIHSYPLLNEVALEKGLKNATQAQQVWQSSPFHQRGELLLSLAQQLRTEQEELARLMTIEMGKPIREARVEVEKCAWVCEFYAQKGESFLSPQLIRTEAQKSYVSFQPLGLVLAIMPWNFPLWQVFRFAAPALMAGNGALLKHSENVGGCALAIEKLFKSAGFPAGLFNNLFIDHEQVGQLIADSRIAAVSLTGSTRAGKTVAAQAGGQIKKTVLELGGSDPYLILEDADLQTAADMCIQSRMLNNGQSCIAAKRLIVIGTVERYEEFIQLIKERLVSIKMGDPMEDSTQLGPMARLDLRDQLHRQVRESVNAGARLVLGGSIPDQKGAWYPPTLLADIQSNMPAYQEELFGPVAVVFYARDEAEGIKIANDTLYGLGAAVFTANEKRGEQIALQLQAGCCFVNAFVRSDPRLPFGGIKRSGFGRELSADGIREFVNVKTVYIA